MTFSRRDKVYTPQGNDYSGVYANFAKYDSILNVSKVKPGKVTMCSLTQDDGMYYMHMVTGEGITNLCDMLGIQVIR